MARQDEISSTERLLDMIRGRRGKPPSPVQTDSAQGGKAPPVARTGMFRWQPAGLRRKITVGVDLHEGGLRLAAVRNLSERRRELIQCAFVALPPGLRMDGPGMVRTLRRELSKFCSGLRQVEFWVAVSSMEVEARNVRIPKVPPREVANAVYWNLKKEVPLEDGRVVFDYEILRTVQDEGIQRVETLAYTASKEAIESLRQLFHKAGFPLTGISIVPFGVQNLFRSRWIDNGEDSVCTLFVGRDWSRIDLFDGDTLVLTRDVKTGRQSMAESLREYHERRTDGPALMDTLDTGGESPARQMLDDFMAETAQRYPTADTVATHPVFAMIRPALDRVIRQVERTIQHYALKIGQKTVRRIYLSGFLTEHAGLVDYIGRQVGLPVAVIDPFPADAGPAPPADPGERGDFLPAVGMALSQQYQTPNFIFTYRHKERQRAQSRINRLIFIGIFAMMVAAAGFSFWQSQRLDLKQGTIRRLQAELESYMPRVDQNLLLQIATKVNKRDRAIRRLAEKHLAEVVVGELARSMPEKIRLTQILLETVSAKDAPAGPGAAAGAESAPEPVRRLLTLEGLVIGQRVELEPVLADFMVRLGTVDLFDRAVIRQKMFENLRDRELLRFSIQIELV